MVHALREARRVLKPEGVVIDLRPGIAHRRVNVVRGGQAEPIGAMREDFGDDHAANRAVQKMVSQRLLKFEGRTRVSCDRRMDTLDEFREWVAEFLTFGKKLPPHDWLIERVGAAMARGPGKAKVVVNGPLDLRVLRKADRKANRSRRTLDRALGLLERPGRRPPTDAQMQELLADRRMKK